MGQGKRHGRAAMGFTVKSGWAAVVLLGGPAASPRMLDARRLELSDPAIPETRQPYHAGFGTARSSGPELSRLVASVERFGRRSVSGLIQHYTAEGHKFAGVGIVVGSLIDPERIANGHIRIHALEGQLFRKVVEHGAGRSRLPCSIWRQRDLYARAAAILKQPEPKLRVALSVLRRPELGPWRAEQKAAALAAWLVLAGRGRKNETIRRRHPNLQRVGIR